MNSKRIEWLDMAKGYVTIMIVLSHSNYPYLYARIITPFCLAMFFFISGYLFYYKKGNIKEFFKNKIEKRIVPMFMLGTIGIVISRTIDFNNFVIRIKGMLVQVSGKDDILWFISCLFICEILYFFICKITNNNYKKIIIIILAIAFIGFAYVRLINIPIPWHIETACIVIMFLGLGNLYRKQEKKLEFLISKKNLMITIVIYLFLIFSYANKVDLHLSMFKNIPMFILTSFLGIFMVIQVSKLIPSNNFIKFAGANSLIFYAFQSKPLKFFEVILNRTNIPTNPYITCIIVTIFTCLILIVPSILINRYFPFLIGIKKRNNKTINNAA